MGWTVSAPLPAGAPGNNASRVCIRTGPSGFRVLLFSSYAQDALGQGLFGLHKTLCVSILSFSLSSLNLPFPVGRLRLVACAWGGVFGVFTSGFQ